MASRFPSGMANPNSASSQQRSVAALPQQPANTAWAVLRQSATSSRSRCYPSAAGFGAGPRRGVLRSAASSGHHFQQPRKPNAGNKAHAAAAAAAAASVKAAPAGPPAELQQQEQREFALSSQQPQQPFLFPSGAVGGTVQSYEDEYQLLGGAELPLEAQIGRLEAILGRLRAADTVEDKVRVLREVDSVTAFVCNPRNAAVVSALSRLDAPSQLLLLSLAAMRQEHVLQEPAGAPPSPPDSLLPRLTALAARLARVDQFYDSVGGLLGYQIKSLQLIVAGIQDKDARSKQQQQHSLDDHPPPPQRPASPAASPPPPEVRFHVPRGMDLAGEEGAGVGVAAAAQGLAALPFMAEVYPVGGAGDRLGLVDEATGESLPAAMLPYAGRTLLEVLIRDLQAREYLYFQLTGRQVTTPVAIMTSDAKGNHDRVSRLLGAELGWAGRGPEAFRLFRQPMVPVVGVEDGRWLLSRPLGPMMKPGGHGAIWKLMWDEGVFDWLMAPPRGRRAALVRQISNPMAGTDTTLLALAGAGAARRGGGSAAFGFMSCERAVGAAEGMNVLQERRRWVPEATPGAGASSGGGRWVYEYGVTNVEYTEFERLGLSDEAVAANSSTSVFPANTNVLYVGLHGARRIVAEAVSRGDGEQLLPGLIFNLNKKVSYTDPLGGDTRQVTAGRMESTMQNMADYLTDAFDRPMDPRELPAGTLSTFLVSNLRRKVTSSAKKRRTPGSSRIAQTPDGSFYDLQRNAWQLLQRCGLADVPEPGSPEQYLDKGPGFIFLFHPALGPLWDVIAQKVVGGSLTHGSELVLEVAEARLQQLHLDGSLQIYAENVMGHLETAGLPAGKDHSAGGAGGLYGAIGAAAANAGAGGIAAAAAAAAETTLSISSLHNGTLEMPLPRSVAHGGPTQQQQQMAAAAGGGGGATVGGGVSPAPGGGGVLRYGRRCGRVQLVNVRVVNGGIDWSAPDNVYWKHQVSRRESCKIVLLGQSEFEAHDVTISGSHTFVVPDGFRLTVTAAGSGAGGAADGFRTQLTPLAPAGPGAVGGGFEPSWEWVYSMDTAGAVRLSYVGAALPRAAPAAGGMVATAMAAAERRGKYVLDFNI